VFTLREWQNKLWEKIYDKNFLEDKEIINKAFEELCQPIIDGDSKSKCKFEKVKDDEDEVVLRLKITDKIHEVYELTISEKTLLLCSGFEYYDHGEKNIRPICLIEYKTQDENRIYDQEIYIVNVKDKEKYGQQISYSFEQGEKTEVRKVGEDKPYVFNKDKYKRIINNLMEIAIIGTFEDMDIFKDYTMDEPFI
jgi:hypothetical protein